MEALQGRKPEQAIGQAGNDERRPVRCPARGVQGRASKQRDLRDDRGQKRQYCLAFAEASRGEAPRGIQEGTESPSGDPLRQKTWLLRPWLHHPPNRRMRTRMYGGVGGGGRVPLSRFYIFRSWLSIDVVFRLQTLHVLLQVGLVGIIRHGREGGLDLFDGFVEVTLTTVNTSHTNMGRPIVGELFRV